MKLEAFRVQNFRSVEDSGWITTEDVTALIGTNESGKTNLLMPLWKLKPAKLGDVDPTADYPRMRFNEIRGTVPKPVFISAQFALSDELAEEIARLAEVHPADVATAIVHRNFDGEYTAEFPKANLQRSLRKSDLQALLSQAQADLEDLAPSKQEEPMKEAVLEVMNAVAAKVAGLPDPVTVEHIRDLATKLRAVDLSKAVKASEIRPRFERLPGDLDRRVEVLTQPAPEDVEGVTELVIEHMPAFVYYSNYGNLDSEIYLPHVIENLKRTDLGPKEEAKARTLKVLFDFVDLSPQEIWELGKETPVPPNQRPTDAQIEEGAKKKRQREILLQSASAKLTEKFREWWKQGDYRFRFQADGNHFRIWVSDDRRPEEVELENRSTGLQWFLSFYLIFLVESEDAHEGTILLLDEAGLSLHPLAQKDLSAFFENLARTNQLLYTTHSPFLVDPDHLDRVRKVFVGPDGRTRASSDLRAGELTSPEGKSGYAVHAALGLSISDGLLQGCQSIIVEGPSDQRYLTAIKNYLIGKGRINPGRDIIFMPSGGASGMKAVVPLLGGRNGELPHVILDSDAAGEGVAKSLTDGLYRGAEDRVIRVGDLLGLPDAEVEDLFPTDFLASVISRYLYRPSGIEEEFADVVKSGEPIVPQVEAYAALQGVSLTRGWKVEIAGLVKARLLNARHDPVPTEIGDRWEDLFDQIMGSVEATTAEGAPASRTS
jgi:energy-coupling factor transporter ATP-binding protein EcfA2